MSASDETKGDAGRGPEEDQDQPPDGQTPDGAHEVPLFLRGRSDGPKGNEQDEKDGVGE